jgi:hypothetical protein
MQFTARGLEPRLAQERVLTWHSRPRLWRRVAPPIELAVRCALHPLSPYPPIFIDG